MPGTVTTRCFEGLYHEIFNETESAPVFDTLKAVSKLVLKALA